MIWLLSLLCALIGRKKLNWIHLYLRFKSPTVGYCLVEERCVTGACGRVGIGLPIYTS